MYSLTSGIVSVIPNWTSKLLDLLFIGPAALGVNIISYSKYAYEYFMKYHTTFFSVNLQSFYYFPLPNIGL